MHQETKSNVTVLTIFFISMTALASALGWISGGVAEAEDKSNITPTVPDEPLKVTHYQPENKAATGINLYIAKDDWGPAVKNPNPGKSKSDDFVAHIQTPEVPSKSFIVRWTINDEVFEEDVLQPNSTSWLVGAKWKALTTGRYGEYTLKIIVDANNDIAETNENDNEYVLKMEHKP